MARALVDLGLTRLELGKFAEAEAPLREGLAILEKATPESWERFDAMVLLGASLSGQKKYPEAEPLISPGREGLRREPVHPLPEPPLPRPGRRPIPSSTPPGASPRRPPSGGRKIPSPPIRPRPSRNPEPTCRDGPGGKARPSAAAAHPGYFPTEDATNRTQRRKKPRSRGRSGPASRISPQGGRGGPRAGYGRSGGRGHGHAARGRRGDSRSRRWRAAWRRGRGRRCGVVTAWYGITRSSGEEIPQAHVVPVAYGSNGVWFGQEGNAVNAGTAEPVPEGPRGMTASPDRRDGGLGGLLRIDRIQADRGCTRRAGPRGSEIGSPK